MSEDNVAGVDLNDMVVTLDLTVAEVNVVLSSLGKHPFVEIEQLIGKIRKQGLEQVQNFQSGEVTGDSEEQTPSKGDLADTELEPTITDE